MCVHGWLWSRLNISLEIDRKSTHASWIWQKHLIMLNTTLFEKLIYKDIPDIYIQLLLVTYHKHCANVKWNGSVLNRITIKNGVKQGVALSAILFSVYWWSLQNIKKEEIWMLDKQQLLWNNRLCWWYICTITVTWCTSGHDCDLWDLCKSMHNLSFSTDMNPNKCKTRCLAFFNTFSMWIVLVIYSIWKYLHTHLLYFLT